MFYDGHRYLFPPHFFHIFHIDKREVGGGDQLIPLIPPTTTIPSQSFIYNLMKILFLKQSKDPHRTLPPLLKTKHSSLLLFKKKFIQWIVINQSKSKFFYHQKKHEHKKIKQAINVQKKRPLEKSAINKTTQNFFFLFLRR